MTDAKRLQPDITLLLDMDGVIREATVSHNMPESSVTAWLGQQWISTVGDVGGEKVKRMVDDARSAGVSAFRQINQRFPSGMEIPMEYTTVLLGGKAGLLAIGKSLQSVAELQARFVAAQQALERDYWKLREVETRYRQLFQASNEAVILVGATDLRIVEANPAALEALGYAAQKPQSATGRGFVEELAVGEREAFMGMLARVREQGKAPGLLVHLGRDKKSWMARASLLAPHPESVFLLHLSPIGLPQAGAVSAATISIDDMVERMPDGFIVVDQEGVIRRANRAFLDLVEVGAKGSVIGERIGRWLWQPGADWQVLLANIRRHGLVRLFNTTIQSELSRDTEVEVSATADSESDPRYIGIMLRVVGRRLSNTTDDKGLRFGLESITEKIGKMPLRALVRETVSVVERHYVKEALDLADGNRTVAAELLGLSRQSLYAKLNRYDIENLSEQIAGD